MPATGDRITKRKDGLFQGTYTAQTPDGPRRKYVYGRKYKDVERKLAEAMGDAAKGLVFDDENLNVGEYLDRWLSDAVRGTVRESTFSAISTSRSTTSSLPSGGSSSRTFRPSTSKASTGIASTPVSPAPRSRRCTTSCTRRSRRP